MTTEQHPDDDQRDGLRCREARHASMALAKTRPLACHHMRAARSFRKRKVVTSYRGISIHYIVSVATCRTEVFFSSANVATRHDTRVSLFQADVARKVATSTERARGLFTPVWPPGYKVGREGCTLVVTDVTSFTYVNRRQIGALDR